MRSEYTVCEVEQHDHNAQQPGDETQSTVGLVLAEVPEDKTRGQSHADATENGEASHRFDALAAGIERTHREEGQIAACAYVSCADCIVSEVQERSRMLQKRIIPPATMRRLLLLMRPLIAFIYINHSITFALRQGCHLQETQ